MGKTLDKQALDRQRFFFDHYGVTENDLEHYLAAALSAGGDYADLYFEYLSSTSLMVDESMVKSASQGISAGCGVRVDARPLAARPEVQRIDEGLSAARHQSTARGHMGGNRRERVERQACQGRNRKEDVRVAECGRQIGGGDSLDRIARVSEQCAELRNRECPLGVAPWPAAIRQDCSRLRNQRAAAGYIQTE